MIPKEYTIVFSLLAPDRILASYDNGTGTEQIEMDELIFFTPIAPDGENGISRALIQFFLLGNYPNFARADFEAAAKARPFRVGTKIQSLHPEGIRKRLDGSFDAIIYHDGTARAVNIAPDEIAGYQPKLERAFINARTWAMQAGFTRFSQDLIDALNARTYLG